MWLSLVALLVGADPDSAGADAAFKRMEQAMKCRTLQVELAVTVNAWNVSTSSLKGHLAVAEGDKVRLELDGKEQGKPKKIVVVSDGKKLHFSNSRSPSQEVVAKKQLGEAYLGSLRRAGIFFAVFTPAAPGQEDTFDPEVVFPVSDIKLGKMEVISDREAQVVEYKLTPGGYNEPLEVKVWVDVKSHLPVKRVITHQRGKDSFIVTELYTKLVANGKIDEKEFELPK